MPVTLRELNEAKAQGAFIEYEEDFYKNNKDIINRYKVEAGKVSYDINQTKILENIADVPLNSLKLLLTYRSKASIRAIDPKNYEKNLEEYEAERKIYYDEIKQARNVIDEEINSEPSYIQKLATGMVFHTARQYADVRQAPLLILGNMAGAKIGKNLISTYGASATVAQKEFYETSINAVINGLTNAGEEAVDQLMTDGTLDPETLFYSFAGGAGLPFFLKGVSKGAKKVLNIPIKNLEIDNITETSKYANKIYKEGKEVIAQKVEDIAVIADDVAKQQGALGRVVDIDSFHKKITTVDDVHLDVARDTYFPKVIERVQELSKDTDPLKLLKENPKKFNSLVKKALKNKNLSPEDTEALTWAKNMLDPKKIKDIDYDYKRLGEALDDALINPKETPLDDLGKQIDSQTDDEFWKEQEALLDNEFGLTSEKVNSKSVKTAMFKLMDETGKIFKKKYNVKSLKSLSKALTDKYFKDTGIVLKIEKVEPSSLKNGRYAELRVNSDKDFVIQVAKNVRGDKVYGAVRHEFEHMRDFLTDSNFIPKDPKLEMAKTIKETINKGYGGHFKKYGDMAFEYSYIIHNRLNNLVNKNGELDIETARTFGLDIPEVIDSKTKQAYKSIIQEAKKIDNPKKQLEFLRKEVSKYNKYRKGITNLVLSEGDLDKKVHMVKEYLDNIIYEPMNVLQENYFNSWIEDLSLKMPDGEVWDIKKILDVYEIEDGKFAKFLFGREKLPEKLKGNPIVYMLQSNVLNKLKELTAGTELEPRDIINSCSYDNRWLLENLISKDELAKNLDDAKELDVGKLVGEATEVDSLIGKNIDGENVFISPKTKELRDIFAEKYWERFNDPRVSLRVKIRNKASDYQILRDLKRARKISKGEDLKELVINHELYKMPKIKEFLDKNPHFFKGDDIKILEDPVLLEEAVMNAKKDTARIFLTEDIASVKGSDANVVLGTWAHKLGRFKLYENLGYLNPRETDTFVKMVNINSDNALNKLIKDTSVAYAIKEVMPGGSQNKLFSIFKSIMDTRPNPYNKSWIRAIEEDIDDTIGEKLGRLTKVPIGKGERYLGKAIKLLNQINLAGPKFIQEFGQEPLGMARDSTMLWNGGGILSTYKNITKASMLLSRNWNDPKKLGINPQYLKSTALNLINIIDDQADDVTGYKERRILEYGTAGERLEYKLSNGLQKLNFYSLSQRIMKLAANYQATDIVADMRKYANLEDAISELGTHAKKVALSLDLKEVDFDIMKKTSETNSYKELNLFNANELREKVTKEMYEKYLGKEISPEEFAVRLGDSMEKVKSFYTKVLTDVSPTEAKPRMRSRIDRNPDTTSRIFQKLMLNFKSSILEQTRRMGNSFYYSNVADGKFNYKNSVYWKRVGKTLIPAFIFTAGLSMVKDDDFYSDPLETINEKVDDIFDNFANSLWNFGLDYTNFWGISTGSNIVARPRQFVDQITKREYDKAFNTMLKTTVNTYNYNLGKKAFELGEEGYDKISK